MTLQNLLIGMGKFWFSDLPYYSIKISSVQQPQKNDKELKLSGQWKSIIQHDQVGLSL